DRPGRDAAEAVGEREASTEDDEPGYDCDEDAFHCPQSPFLPQFSGRNGHSVFRQTGCRRSSLVRGRAPHALHIVLRMDFELSPAQREVHALGREFARQEIDPHPAEWDRQDRFPRELFTKLAELGLMGTCGPEEYGGAGADFPSYILVIEELSRADAGVGVTVAVHTSAVTLPILMFGTDEQRSRFVPPLARGELIGAFALTEAESGSDAGSLRTAATPDGDGWRLSGAKQFISTAEHAGTFLLFARTDRGTPGADGVSAFILGADHGRVT